MYYFEPLLNNGNFIITLKANSEVVEALYIFHSSLYCNDILTNVFLLIVTILIITVLNV